MKKPTDPKTIRVRSWTTTTSIPVVTYPVRTVKFKRVRIRVKVTDANGHEHWETVTTFREPKRR
jgi:hypothetical protein